MCHDVAFGCKGSQLQTEGVATVEYRKKDGWKVGPHWHNVNIGQCSGTLTS